MPRASPHLVAGKVNDTSGNPLADVTVTLTHSSISPVLTAVSNAAGEYRFNLGKLSSQWIAGQTITFIASKIGIGEVTLETTISRGGGQIHNLTLEEVAAVSNFDFERQPGLADRYPFTMAMLTDNTGKQITNSNRLPVNSETMLEIARGNILGMTFIHKFGEAPDFDTGDNFVTVWDGANDGGAVDQNVYVYSTTDDIDSLSSSDDGDTQDIEVHGLDVNYVGVVQTITLTGQTPKTLTTKLIRVFRMINVGSTNLAGNLYCYKSGGTVTAGVPQTDADVRAIISLHPSNKSHNQTLMAVYTIPAGKKGYLCKFYMSSIGGVKTAINEMHLEVRPFGQVFQTKHTGAIVGTGTSHFSHTFEIPEVVPAKTDIEITVNTDVASSGVSAGFDIILIDD